MGTGLKPVGIGWGWKESPRGGAEFGRNYVDAGRVRVEVVNPAGREWGQILTTRHPLVRRVSSQNKIYDEGP